MATLMCFIGVVLFSIMMTWGFNATAEQTRRTLRIDNWPWLDRIQIFFIVLTVLMALFAIFFLGVGFTATGATREDMYKDKTAKCGGKCACIAALAWCGVLLIAWLFIISITSMINLSYWSFDGICGSMTSFTDADCIDFGVFIPLIRDFSNSNLRMCGGDAQQFCALTSTARSWYIVGWVGAAIVILGLALFIGIHAANYAHIGNASRYVELRDLALETMSTPPRQGERNFYNGYNAGPGAMREKDRSIWSEGSRFSVGSASRHADQMSDSVSQYNYNARKMKNGY